MEIQLTETQLKEKRITDAAWQLAWEWLEREGLVWDRIHQVVRDQLIRGFMYQAQQLPFHEVIRLARAWNYIR